MPCDRAVAGALQHAEAALSAGLSTACPGGDCATNGGSPVAYGSLRSAIRNPDSDGGCAINSLTRLGTKSRSGHFHLGLTVFEEAFVLTSPFIERAFRTL